ncbi:nuclear transport factor 2 family protein [Burkholderia ubonensis]|uniref:nuclear transport factor 2 family protein n=1 Tax=Burkholderia ubonensis TaxID=101571 RepID=UPI000754F23E|nr:nuclear transport factor 2 family protein [Burkholderia ubonensis]
METQHFITGPVPPQILNYVNGWVARRADLVVSSMADGASYIDKPHAAVSKSGMKDHLEKVAWVNFPDMTYDTLRLIGGANAYVWEWALHASKCGVLVGGTSARKFYCEGVDILILNSEGQIEQVICHFDRKALWDSVLN